MAQLPMKSLPLIGIGLLVVSIGFFLIKSDREETEEIIPDKEVPEAGISTEKFKVYKPYTDKGITWTLEADEVHYFPLFVLIYRVKLEENRCRSSILY